MLSRRWTDRIPAACFPPRLSLALLIVLLGAVPALAEEPAAPAPWLADGGAPQVGRDGVARSIFRPEFRSAVDLHAQLKHYGLKGLRVDLVSPRVAVARPPGARKDPPPVPSRLLLRGSSDVVREARQALRRLDAPQRAVFVSILVSEVRGWDRFSHGGSMIFDKGAGTNPENTIFRTFSTNFEPDDFLRASLTGAMPFEGTSLVFGDMDVSGGAFDFVLRMLAKQGEADFLAWPNLLLNEGEPGHITSVRLLPQLLLQPGSGDPRFRAAPLEEVGLKMRVTPLKIGADAAHLEIDVWLRIPEEIADGTAPIGTLRLRRRQVQTRLTVRDREPLLVGGLRLRHGERTRRGLPRPKALALLDPLHSAKVRDSRRTEVLFLIRVRVVPPCRRPSELYPDGYDAWIKGRTPSGRRLDSPWRQLPRPGGRLDDSVPPPLPPGR